MLLVRYGILLLFSGMVVFGSAQGLTVAILSFHNSDTSSSRARYLDKPVTEALEVRRFHLKRIISRGARVSPAFQ